MLQTAYLRGLKDSMTYNLTKLEEKFWQFIKADEHYDKNEIRITEDLLTQSELLYIPFGHMEYFLVIEDEKPVIFAHLLSRMDLDSVCFIDENGWKCYDVYYPEENKDIWEKYQAHRRNVKGSMDMKGLPKARK